MAESSPPNGINGGTSLKVIDWVVRFTIPLLVAILIGAGAVIWDLHTRMTSIESNRYTDIDAAKDHANLQARLAAAYPPSWLLDNIEDLEDDLRELTLEVRKLSTDSP